MPEPTPPFAHPDDKPAAAHDDSDGALDRAMRRIFGRSWRTSCLGVGSLLCALAPFVPGLPPALVAFAQQAQPLLLGGGLLVAKDGKVSGKPK